MAYDNLLYEREGSLAILTLNRPNRRNALSLGLMTELIDCLEAVGRDREIRAVIVAAAGAVFSSGHDLSEAVGPDITPYPPPFDVLPQPMTKPPSIPHPP